MKKISEFLKNNFILIIIILFCLLIFSPAIGNFFSADDCFHLRVVQITNIGQFFNFFSFTRNNQSIAVYRPLSTQLFFWTFYNIFKFNAWVYFLFGLVLFAIILINIYSLTKELRFSKNISLLTTLIYGVSASNFTRINFISAYQELFLVLFVLLAIRSYLRKSKIYILFFILALFLGLLILADFLKKQKIKNKLKEYFLVFLITTIYLILRIFVFKGADGDSYIWDFSIKKATNTLMWYVFWSFGAPEFLVDYVGSGLKIVPKFFTDIPFWSQIILIQFGALLACFSTILIVNLKEIKIFLFSCAFFLLSIFPVLFLPWHKFTLELGLPLIGFSILISVLVLNKKIIGIIFIIFYIILNLTTIFLLNGRNYSVTRGKITNKIYQYFSKNYPVYPKDKYFRFVNDTNPKAKQWGSSKQVSYALSGSDFFKVFYKNKNVKVFYDDFDLSPPTNTINLSSKQFLY
jgi:hypothetical protein